MDPPQLAQGGRGAVMKHLGPYCILRKSLFLNFILVEVLFMAAGWTPVRAGEGSSTISSEPVIQIKACWPSFVNDADVVAFKLSKDFLKRIISGF